MAARTLAITPDGHLNIEGQFQSRAFSCGAWEGFEAKLIAREPSAPRQRKTVPAAG